MRVLGLTGGIATGKSTVAEMFADLGAVVISADQVAREIVRPGEPALREILEEFGPDTLRTDGSLNRTRLGEIVFSNPQARLRLEAITHPHILQRQAQMIESLRARPDSERLVVILEAPLLFEANAEKQVDQVVVTASEQNTQIARLKERDHLSRGEALKRINAQWPLEDKIRKANWVINTDCSLEETRRQVHAIWDQLGID